MALLFGSIGYSSGDNSTANVGSDCAICVEATTPAYNIMLYNMEARVALQNVASPYTLKACVWDDEGTILYSGGTVSVTSTSPGYKLMTMDVHLSANTTYYLGYVAYRTAGSFTLYQSSHTVASGTYGYDSANNFSTPEDLDAVYDSYPVCITCGYKTLKIEDTMNYNMFEGDVWIDDVADIY